MTHLLTMPEAFALIIAGMVAIYLMATTKPQEAHTESLEQQEGNYTTPVYIERYGAVIQAQQYN